ncbi:MAG: adenylate kinase [Nitrospira sp.]|nr:adenylate kinase [Nitrospira sp.]
MRLVFLGAPGVGKGTQAEKLSSKFGLKKISTGDLLREAVRNGTPLGLEAKSFMDQGRLVPDSVVIGLVREKLSDTSCSNGFVLDGFPRTVPQAEELGRVLDERSIDLSAVINFEADRDEIVNRLSGRRSCPKCQATYHTEFAPSKTGNSCERCSELLVQRSDDTKEAIETRLKVYQEQTAPLIAYYQNRNLLSQVASMGPIDSVFDSLVKVITADKHA